MMGIVELHDVEMGSVRGLFLGGWDELARTESIAVSLSEVGVLLVAGGSSSCRSGCCRGFVVEVVQKRGEGRKRDWRR